MAAFLGKTEAVIALMDQGAPAAIMNDESKTPMHLAAEKGSAR